MSIFTSERKVALYILRFIRTSSKINEVKYGKGTNKGTFKVLYCHGEKYGCIVRN